MELIIEGMIYQILEYDLKMMEKYELKKRFESKKDFSV
jgi:hypothetical protein